MVGDPENTVTLLRWSDSGQYTVYSISVFFSFYSLPLSPLVLDHERFAREVLGGWFQNFASFVRLLNNDIRFSQNPPPPARRLALKLTFGILAAPIFIGASQTYSISSTERKRTRNGNREEVAVVGMMEWVSDRDDVSS